MQIRTYTSERLWRAAAQQQSDMRHESTKLEQQQRCTPMISSRMQGVWIMTVRLNM